MSGRTVSILCLKVKRKIVGKLFVDEFIVFIADEEGQDAGGLLREWYVIISRDIFNPMYALFTVSPGDRVTYMINSASHYNSNHLCYYKFVGRVIGKIRERLSTAV